MVCVVTQDNPFSSEIDFEYGVAMSLSPIVRRFVANNPGPLTFKGTNVYILGRQEVAVIDPGPDDDSHVEALLKSLPGENITKIFLTHTHKDHCGAVDRLCRLTGASTYALRSTGALRGAYRAGKEEGGLVSGFADLHFRPDHQLADGDEVVGEDWTLRVVHTPGHAPDHICYALVPEKALFTGDHVMPWSTSVIAPPEGNMRDYMASLSKLSCRDDQLYLPGHGGRVRTPKRLLRAYVLHRQWREKSILKAVQEGRRQVVELVPLLYRDINDEIIPAATLSVLAHLQYLVQKGKVQQTGGEGLEAVFCAETSQCSDDQ
jgi:glyoxylase-like metal-dependent hydrolase (beta-lactamase superfamily II)